MQPGRCRPDYIIMKIRTFERLEEEMTETPENEEEVDNHKDNVKDRENGKTEDSLQEFSPDRKSETESVGHNNKL
jgi:hypothetical protein